MERMEAKFDFESCCHMLAAASPLTIPLCSMGMLAHPIMVSN
jgi:hypothetical protein